MNKLLKDEKGEGIISGLFIMLILFIVFFVGIDIAGYISTSWKLRNACNEALTMMKMDNGYNAEIENSFLNFASAQGLNIGEVVVTGHPHKAQRGEPVTIQVTYPYKLQSLRPLGQALQFQVRVEMTGMAQDFIRSE